MNCFLLLPVNSITLRLSLYSPDLFPHFFKTRTISFIISFRTIYTRISHARFIF